MCEVKIVCSLHSYYSSPTRLAIACSVFGPTVRRLLCTIAVRGIASPLVGNLKSAKSRTDSQICVNAGGRYECSWSFAATCPSKSIHSTTPQLPDFCYAQPRTTCSSSFPFPTSPRTLYSSQLSTESAGLVAPEPDDDEDSPVVAHLLFFPPEYVPRIMRRANRQKR